jgi:small subunit ribosomal protein S10
MLLKKKSTTKFEIQLKSVDKKSLSFYTHFLKKMFYKANAIYSLTNLPIKKKRITLLKSPHVNKSAREQFELRSYKSIWKIKSKLTYEFAKVLFKNKPQTVSIAIKQIGG